MSLNITVPKPKAIKPKISVFGVGGAGGNALNNMITSNLEGVEFISANTDAQSLQNSLASNRIQLGLNITKGLGAGSFPEQGKAAAEENINEISKFLEGNNMIFIAAGMGGGTGTGAAPVIAKLAKEKDILTVGVVTKPFDFEGKYRMETAIKGIEELKKYVDTLIVIPNQNLFRIANEKTTFESAFKMADDVLHAGVRGITDLITMPGLVNLDFADIKTIMIKMGKAMMGTGEAEGEDRAVRACQEAISNPLLDDVSIKGAKGVLVNMTGGPDMTLFEADQAVNEIRKEVDERANIIFGSAFNEDMKGKIRVSVVATGIDAENTELTNDNSTKETNEDEGEKPAFFDPSGIQGINSEIQEINEKDLKPKVSLDNFINQEQAKIKINDQEEATENEEKDLEISNDTNNIKFETVAANNFTPAESEEDEQQNLEQEEEEEEGFSLFKFITGGKKHKKAAKNIKMQEKILQKQEEEDKNENNKNDDDDNNASTKQEVLDFSFHDNIIEELPKEKAANDELKSEDDVLNIPAFFRKKKNSG